MERDRYSDPFLLRLTNDYPPHAGCGFDSSGSWIKIRASGGPCEHGNEPSGYMKGGEFLDRLSDYYLLKKDLAPWSYHLSFKPYTF
jgi:hypothetical protein